MTRRRSPPSCPSAASAGRWLTASCSSACTAWTPFPRYHITNLAERYPAGFLRPLPRLSGVISAVPVLLPPEAMTRLRHCGPASPYPSAWGTAYETPWARAQYRPPAFPFLGSVIASSLGVEAQLPHVSRPAAVFFVPSTGQPRSCMWTRIWFFRPVSRATLSRVHPAPGPALVVGHGLPGPVPGAPEYTRWWRSPAGSDFPTVPPLRGGRPPPPPPDRPWRSTRSSQSS